MRIAAACLLLASTGCDILFQLEEIPPDARKLDASEPFSFDAPQLDTTGWPTDGMVMPRPCDAGSTFNEDGDTKTDECDNCPLDANASQVDTDRDGIGDLCDPHPMFAVERLVAFEGFNGDLSFGRNVAGIWSVETGLLRQTRNERNRSLFAITGRWRQPTLVVRFGNVVRSGTVSNWNVGGYLFSEIIADSTQPDGVRCFGHFGDGGDMTMYRMRDTNRGPEASVTFVGGEPLTLALASHQLGVPPQCAGARLAAAFSQLATQLALMPDETDPDDATFGVFTENARADFEGFTVYETVWPPR